MEKWREAKQNRVWRGSKVRKLEKRFDTMREHDLLMQKVASLVVGKSILDVGCGLGHFYEYAVKLKPDINYVGVDQSVDMLSSARARHPNATFIQQNLYELNQRKADTVICLDVLHHQPGLEPAFSILKKHARKALIVTIWIYERYQGGKHKRQYIGCSGEIVTWHTEKELQKKFSGLEYDIYRGIGYSWKDMYCFRL